MDGAIGDPFPWVGGEPTQELSLAAGIEGASNLSSSLLGEARPETQIPEGAAAADEKDPDEPPGARSGVFQRATFDSTWLWAGSGTGDFGMTDLELKGVFGLPCPTRKSPLVISPGFAVHFFNNAGHLDLPGEVYDAYTQFRWLKRLTPRIGLDFAVTPGWYSDFQQGSNEALRITGYGAGMITLSGTTKLVLGAAYLDRKDLEVLPVGGLLWAPTPDTSFELIAPRPRIARRIDWAAERSETLQNWVYVAGELGGGAWAVERAAGAEDVISYRDYRVLLGLERKKIGDFSSIVEVGYVFGRKLQYDSGSPDVRPRDAVLLRGGISY